MLSAGFADAPVSRGLIAGLVISSLLISIFDIRQYFYILVEPHLWNYHQTWRILVYQLCYTNSTEVLFATMTIYNLRVIERIWGPRKYLSFILLCYPITTLLPPTILALVVRPLSFQSINYLPAGLTPILFALLAQYHATIPHIYKYRIATTITPMTGTSFNGLTFSDKSYTYLLALQLSLSQFPGTLICAVIGWVVGYSWRNEIFPGALSQWRVPAFMVGMRSQKRAEGFESLRRRMEVEHPDAVTASGVDGRGGEEAGRRRTLGRQLLDQFRGDV